MTTHEEREVASDLRERELEAYRSTARRMVVEAGLDARIDDGDDVDLADDTETGGPRGAWVAAWVWVEHG